MKKKIFFDLDGTLLDSSDRLYNLFCDLIPECKFSKEEYWNFKRNKINHEMIIKNHFPNYDFDEFNTNWLNLIETEKYLNFDKLYDFTLNLIKDLDNIYLLTARQSKEQLFNELERLQIKDYFKEIYVTENKLTKLDIMKSLNLGENDIYISDTGRDIAWANETGMKSVGVDWGFMSAEKLKDYKPDVLCYHHTELFNLLIKK